VNSEPSTTAILLSLSSGDSTLAAENAASAIAIYHASGDLVSGETPKKTPLISNRYLVAMYKDLIHHIGNMIFLFKINCHNY